MTYYGQKILTPEGKPLFKQVEYLATLRDIKNNLMPVRYDSEFSYVLYQQRVIYEYHFEQFKKASKNPLKAMLRPSEVYQATLIRYARMRIFEGTFQSGVFLPSVDGELARFYDFEVTRGPASSVRLYLVEREGRELSISDEYFDGTPISTWKSKLPAWQKSLGMLGLSGFEKPAQYKNVKLYNERALEKEVELYGKLPKRIPPGAVRSAEQKEIDKLLRR